MDARAERLSRALARASDEIGLEEYYRDLVRPILRMPRERWPDCCAGNCEPCTQTLVAVGDRVRELLGEGE